MRLKQSHSFDCLRDTVTERSQTLDSCVRERSGSFSTAIPYQEVPQTSSSSETSRLDLENGVDFDIARIQEHNLKIANSVEKRASSQAGREFFTHRNHLSKLKLDRRGSGSELIPAKENGHLVETRCHTLGHQSLQVESSGADSNSGGDRGKRHFPKSSSASSLPVSSSRQETFLANHSFRSLKSSQTAVWNTANKESNATFSTQDFKNNSQVYCDSIKNLEQQKIRSFRKKKRSPSWYSVLLSSSYKQKNDAFHKCFKQLPETERLLVDCTCALMKDILVQGRLYISQNYVCFHSNILMWQTTLAFKFKDIEQITKERTVKVFPNAIQFQIRGKEKSSTFTSFTQRDRTYQQIFKLWQNALADKPMTPQELWSNVHNNYGADLGCSSDEDYVKPDSSLSSLISNGNSVKRKKKHKASAHVLKSDAQRNAMKYDEEKSPKRSISSEEGKYSSQVSENEFSEIISNKIDQNGLESNNVETPVDQDDGPSDHVKEGLHREYLLRKFDVSAQYLYGILFGENSNFFEKTLEARGSTDIGVRKWKKGGSENEDNKIRQLSYNLPLPASPLLPKFSHVEELQILHKESIPGRCYAVDSIAQTSGVPYSNYISTTLRYGIRKLTPTSCELKVTWSIKYLKTPWGLVKNFIEKSVHSGMEENAPIFERQLRVYLSHNSRPHTLPAPLQRSTSTSSRKSITPTSSNVTGDSPNSTKDDTPTSNSVHTATVVHLPVQKRNPLTLPTDLNNNANFEKSYQHKVEITNGKWFLRIFCMLFILLLWSNYTMYRRIATLEQIHPNFPKTEADYQTFSHSNMNWDVNSNFRNEASSNTLQLLDRRLSVLEELLRNLTVSSDEKWMSINSEWKELHKSVAKLVELVDKNKQQSTLP